MHKQRKIDLILFVAALLLGACTLGTPLPAVTPPVDTRSALVTTLDNLTYPGILPNQPITLLDGIGHYEEEGPGTPYISLLDQLIATGDLDGDGTEDAVVLLEDHSVGSGHFSFLAAVLNVADEPTPTTALMIGDRIQIKTLAIEGDQVVADLIAQGGSDPACCPTWSVRKTFAFQEGALVESSSEDLSQVTLADLNGTSWRLVELGEGHEPLVADAEITLLIDDGQIAGSAGCNNYNSAVTGEADVLQSFKVGPIAATRKLCPDPIGTQETTYLKLLESVLGWRYNAGLLALAYPAPGDIYAYLLFAPQTEDRQASTGAAERAAALPRFEPVDQCFVALPADLNLDLAMDCGYVVVPEFYHGESSRELKLGITRLNSGQGTRAAPLFMFAGGPGQTHIKPAIYSLFQPELLGNVLTARDIVIIEQRGTEYTDTFLDCPAIYAAGWLAHEQQLDEDQIAAFEHELVQHCINDFQAQGINLDAYNSVENAADVNAVRQALGYDQIIYYGASYGAQLGQHVMRDFPTILEAVVLDGANALSRKSWVEDSALDAQWGIDNLTTLCVADEQCNASYDIPALVDAALALFDNGPLAYAYVDPNDAAVTIDVNVTQADLVQLLHGMQGDRIGAFSLPALLEQLTQGGADTVRELLGQSKAQNLLAARDITKGGEAFLMHFAMVCSDDPVKAADDVVLDGVGTYATIFGKTAAEEYTMLCAMLKVKELPDTTDVNVTLAVPTLLLSGDLDVATPAFRSQVVADALPNATHIIFPGRTHVQIAAVNICAAQVATQFILEPTAPLDTSCLAEAPVLGFPLPDGTMSNE
jgi:pimeloyl-ACP methyl ester carboxylesterase/heat shock protein HslJ